MDLPIGANCSEAVGPVEVIARQNDGPYAIRTTLGWYVVGRIKVQCHNAVSRNQIAVIKTDQGIF